MSKRNYHIGELQDSDGNVVYPHTEASVVFCADGKTVQEKLTSGGIEVLAGVTGKTDSLEVSDSNILATSKAVNNLKTEVNNTLANKSYVNKSETLGQALLSFNTANLPAGNTNINAVLQTSDGNYYVNEYLDRNNTSSGIAIHMQNGNDYKFYIQRGADAVLKKLGSGGKVIPITVSGKSSISGAWTVDLGVEVKSFIWYCPPVPNLAYACGGICYGSIKECVSASYADSFSLAYVINGTKVTFPSQARNTFQDGAVVYFIVATE